MNLTLLLQMAADGLGDRVAFGSRNRGLTYGELFDRARRAGTWLESRRVERVDLVDLNSEAIPLLLFGSSVAGLPFVPLNYRLADEQLHGILSRTTPAVAVVDEPVVARIGDLDGIDVVTRAEFLAASLDASIDPADGWAGEPEDIAVLLFTSGTTGEPKAAVLRHKHLVSYVISTVEFMGAGEDEAALVSVPPYHIAGISAVLTSVYAGRRVVQLPTFDPEAWVVAARDESITHAMVVPTMLGRILDVLERDDVSLPAMRAISYGGGRMPTPVIERAMTRLPQVDFVNAYGLTETSSTIAVLGPDDHRAAFASSDPDVRRRLGSVGQPLPTIELEVRDVDGSVLPVGSKGEIWVRGEQVAGEYLDRSVLNGDGWFETHDAGYLDADGYLYLEGRLDDVIVRGGENMSPGEIEEILEAHPAVADVAVVGLPDTEWGERVVAAVVVTEGATVTTEELQDWVRSKLRSSRTPERIDFVEGLPYTETGKLLRRVVKTDLVSRGEGNPPPTSRPPPVPA
jgi:acyl-CoA synthetase (AMP-forming)/AMP-acid ligase II